MRAFLVEVLRQSQYPVEQINDAVSLGEEGLGIDSLMVAELDTRIFAELGVQLDDAELEQIQRMTLGDLSILLAERQRAVSAHDKP